MQEKQNKKLDPSYSLGGAGGQHPISISKDRKNPFGSLINFDKHLRRVALDSKGHSLFDTSKGKRFADVNLAHPRVDPKDGVPTVDIPSISNGLEHMQKKTVNRNNEFNIGFMPGGIEVGYDPSLFAVLVGLGSERISSAVEVPVPRIGDVEANMFLGGVALNLSEGD